MGNELLEWPEIGPAFQKSFTPLDGEALRFGALVAKSAVVDKVASVRVLDGGGRVSGLRLLGGAEALDVVDAGRQSGRRGEEEAHRVLAVCRQSGCQKEKVPVS